MTASNEYADFVSGEQAKFRTLQGQNAIDAFDDFKNTLNERFNEQVESLPTLNARNQFMSDSRRFLQVALDGAGEHIGTETLKLQDDEANGQIQSIKNFTVANRNTPTALPQGIRDIAAKTAAYTHDIKGIRDPDAINAAVQGQVGSLVSDVVTASMNEGSTLPDQQKALENARSLYNQAVNSTIPGSPNVPMLDANSIDRLGQTLSYREWTLSQRVEREQNKQAANMRVGINNQIDNATSMVEHGVPIHGGLPTPDQIDAAYPDEPEKASLVKENVEDLWSMSGYLGGLSEATPAQIAKMRQEAQPDPNHPETYAKQSRIATALDHAVNARNSALRDDAAGYLITTNPEISRAWSDAQGNPAAFGHYAQQVQTTLGTIGIPAQQQSLLPAYAAKSIVQDLESDPSGAPAKMQNMETHQYGHYWPQVWRDLVQRGGLSPQYQAVGIIDPGNGALLARALAEPGKSGKDITELLPKGVVGKVSAAVTGAPQVVNLTRSILASGGSAAQAATVKSSVETLTYANMVYKGMDATTAQAAAIKAFTGQYKFVPDGGARVPAAKFDTVMSNANVTLRSLSTHNIALPGAATQQAIYNAFGAQESGNNPNVGPSSKGAIGQRQMKPETFNQFAHPGEVITNPQDNVRVSNRAIDHYWRQYGGDLGRVAVAYFAGPGNVAPPGNPTPWKVDTSDGHKTVSSYVADIQNRVGGQIFGQLGGPSGDDYVRAIQAAPSWITSPNADALWLVDHYGRIVRRSNGQPVAVSFNAPPPAPPRQIAARMGAAQAEQERVAALELGQ